MAAICLCDILRMETVDTIQTSGQSQKYFPALLVLKIIHEMFKPACLFSQIPAEPKQPDPKDLHSQTPPTADRSCGGLAAGLKDRSRRGTGRCTQGDAAQALHTGKPLLDIQRDFVISPAFAVEMTVKQLHQW